MTKKQSLAVVLLGAGKGTRMKSSKAKVLHELFHAPMICHVLKRIESLSPEQTVVIVGHQHQEVMAAVDTFGVDFAYQKEQLGTGHAVLCAEDHIQNDITTVMILCGDTPLIRTESLAEMIRQHKESTATVTVMTTRLDNPTHYGRILCDSSGKVQAIVEEKDATTEQKKIDEINTGIYCVNREFLFNTLKNIGTDNSQGEVYLTDIVSLAVAGSYTVEKFNNLFAADVLGVNSRVEMAQAHGELQMRHNTNLMLDGVTMISPETISVDPQAAVGRDTTILPSVHIRGATTIGEGCLLDNNVVLDNCNIGNNVQIGPNSYLNGATISDDTTLEPYTTTRHRKSFSN